MAAAGFHHGLLATPSPTPMDGFDCSPDRPATCDGVDLAAVAAAEGTPLYVYSAAGIVARYRALDAALGEWPHRIHFAMKANSTLGVVRLLHAAGSAFDANSGGEIGVALRAGAPPDAIVFTGVGKTEAELTDAVRLGIGTINAESAGELDRIGRIAASRGVRARVALRVNPDIEADTHPGIATGGRAHKFGVPMGDARDIAREASTHEGLELVGIHAHVGSQITDLDSLGRTAAAVARLAHRLQEDGVPLAHVDLGGGLGIAYDAAEAPSVDAYARLLVDAVRPTGLTLLVEPGRWIVGPTGALIATVVDVKPQADGRHFVVLDAGMSELLRPALYGSAHRLHLLQPRDGPPVTCDVVGPICETTDVVGLGQRMPLPQVGDRILVRDAGAYGVAMASNYNRHPLPAEALIADGAWTLIRRRQSVDEMMASEL
ncbi:MAG: diaminopimelate decarboxylase [Acidobacteria bacterium]|nr:diaminopimelate decarboxylase [Acidobacteriota bacterium]